MSAGLEREAREAAQADDLRARYGRTYNFMQGFQSGYLAAATAREKELAELSVRNKDLTAAIGAWQSAHESDQKEIASLRAKLDAVPVEEIRAVCEWELGLDFPDTAAISSWLATVTKPIPLPEGEGDAR